MRRKEHFDAVVVGAGPAGSTAALVMARAGLRVALLERGEYPGAKNVSGAVLYGTSFLERLLPGFRLSAPVERYITRRSIGFMSDSALFSLDYKSSSADVPPNYGFTVLRPQFDRWLAQRAVEAGALLVPKTVVDGLIREKGAVKGVRSRREKGELYADVVVAADGVNSFLAREAGLRGEFSLQEMTLGIKEVIALDRQLLEERFQINGNEGVAYEFLGSVTGNVCGGGFLYTNRESLSIGIIFQLSSLLRERARPYELLDGLKNHPSILPLIRGGSVKEYSAHMIPEGGWKMFPKLYAPGLLVAGDAAGMVLAAGCYLQGINYAMVAGEAAARTVIAAAKDRDFSALSLARYETFLREQKLIQDFQRFQKAPEFFLNQRIQNVYPAMICRLAEQVFHAAGGPKEKIRDLAAAGMREAGVSWFQLLKDLIEGGRSIGW